MITVYTHTGSSLLVIEETAEPYYLTCPTEFHSDAAAIDCVPIIDQIDTALTWPLCNIRTNENRKLKITTEFLSSPI